MLVPSIIAKENLLCTTLIVKLSAYIDNWIDKFQQERLQSLTKIKDHMQPKHLNNVITK